ncbi:MAG: hypothetical protein DDT19_00249 [Syntrophomonadaceae bacterium]|nr:hypothetical protein [Bacillota bacterium]
MLPSEEQELVKLVNKNLENWQRRTFVHEKQWWMNLAFFLGEHWIKYSEIEKRLITPKPKEKSRVRLRSNHVASMILTLLAKMTANEPAMNVIPNTSSLEDKQAARLGDQIMRWLWKHIEMPDLIEELVLTLLIFGMDYLKVWWDSLAEESFSIQSLDQLGKPFEEEIHLGQVACEVVPPFALAIDPLARTFRQARWVIQQSIRSVEEVEQRTGKKVEPEKVTTPMESKLLSLYSGLQGKELPSEIENATSWKEYWEAPSDKYKSGRLAIVAGGELVYGGENFYGRIPFFPFSMIRVPGRVLGKSLIEDAIPLQKGYNRNLSLMIENANKMAKLKWLVPKHSISEAALTDESGEVVEYVPIGGQKPSQSVVNPLPQYVIYILEKYLRDMEDLFGVHEICVDEETECLTKEGFKKYNELKLGELILTLNIKTRKAEWKPVENIHIQNFEGHLNHLENWNISALVTDEHSWPVYSRRNGKKRRTEENLKLWLCKTKNLLGNYEIPVSTPISEKEFPSATYSDDFVELMGWIVTEGTYNNSHPTANYISITQSIKKHPRQAGRIEQLLGRICPDYWSDIYKDPSYKRWNFGQPLSATIKRMFPDKRLSAEFICRLTKPQLQLLLDTLIDGDGSRNGKRASYFSTDKILIDQVQIIGILLGLSPRITVAHRPPYQDLYRLIFKSYRNTSVRFANYKTRPYDGIIWCPSTVNKTFLARRDGKTYFTGNSRSRPPGGIRAGVALAFLREGDDARISPVVRRIDQGLEQAASFMLELVGKYYTEPRLIRLVGEEQAVEVRRFKGADLKNNYDVRIEAGSALAESKVGKQELLLNLWDRRILTDPEDILKRLEFGQIESDSTKETWRAHAENSLMSQGQVPEVMLYQDHPAHLQIHIEFMRTPIFYNLDPNTQNIFSAHIQTHQQLMVQAAQPQIQAQETVGFEPEVMGGPPGMEGMMGLPMEVR